MNRAQRAARRIDPDIPAFCATGAAAGVFSALVFSVIHYFLISPIWFALIANLVAGGVSGACIAWSYSLAVPGMRTRSWASYNAAFVLILVALAVTSVILFDPVTTIPELLQSKEPPRALIGRALPVTGIFTLASAVLLSLRYRAGWIATGAIVVTAFVIVFFLGLNISILGLVKVPRGSFFLLLEVFALIIALAVVYSWTVALIWRKRN